MGEMIWKTTEQKNLFEKALEDQVGIDSFACSMRVSSLGDASFDISNEEQGQRLKLEYSPYECILLQQAACLIK